ncbi:hypothetical protein QZH41_001570 [Actinostola sp. cb2023]|nr:hypothetical protein QZH41_001570 [Actinostola sp. cb2023]
MKNAQRTQFCDLLFELQPDVIMTEKRCLRRYSSCTGMDSFSCSVKGWKGLSFHKSRIKDESPQSLPSNYMCFNALQTGRLLGSGGFGSVFEADIKGRKVAVKRMHRRSLRNPRAMYESLQAEKLIMPLRHPNIVQTLAILENEDLSEVLIVMQFAGERNLKSLIDNERESIDTRRRLKFATDITRALEFVHGNNLAHLDLKPANVIVDFCDTCRLGDFGCCQPVHTGNIEQDCLPPSPTPSPPSSRSSLTGTFAYRAPELLKGEEPTVKADLYSLGICLWQMLTREQPYGLESQFVVIFGVVANQMRPSLSQARNRRNSPETKEEAQTFRKFEAKCAGERRKGLDRAPKRGSPTTNMADDEGSYEPCKTPLSPIIGTPCDELDAADIFEGFANRPPHISFEGDHDSSYLSPPDKDSEVDSASSEQEFEDIYGTELGATPPRNVRRIKLLRECKEVILGAVLVKDYYLFMVDGIVLPDDSDHEKLENDIEEFEQDLQSTLKVVTTDITNTDIIISIIWAMSHEKGPHMKYLKNQEWEK